jgi:single-stranded-DNA-specific exonuclease
VTGATVGLLDLLDQAGPYGAGHAEPRFALPGVRVTGAEVVGGQHVRCALLGMEGGRLKAVAFRSLENGVGAALLQAAGSLLHVAGTLRADYWRGERRPQLVIEDVAPVASPG